MLVKKIHCPACGANKINENYSGYIYCDYCATFMGYDYDKMEEETMSVFDYDYYMKHQKWPGNVQEYMNITQKMGTAIQSKNKEEYLELMMKYHELDFKLFPKRHSPKLKNEIYLKQQLNFLKHFWAEKLEKGFFEEQDKLSSIFSESQSKITSKTENYQVKWIYDSNLENYFIVLRDYYMESARKTMQMDCMQYYPETLNDSYIEMLYKQSINAYLKILDEETFKKIIEFLGLKSTYIEIPDVALSKHTCPICSHEQDVPENSQQVVCDKCGNINKISSGEIQCMNCGAGFHVEPGVKEPACPYCNSVIKVML